VTVEILRNVGKAHGKGDEFAKRYEEKFGRIYK